MGWCSRRDCSERISHGCSCQNRGATSRCCELVWSISAQCCYSECRVVLLYSCIWGSCGRNSTYSWDFYRYCCIFWSIYEHELPICRNSKHKSASFLRTAFPCSFLEGCRVVGDRPLSFTSRRGSLENRLAFHSFFFLLFLASFFHKYLLYF